MARTGGRASGAAKAEHHATSLAGRLGAALLDARKRLGLRQVGAARRAGLSQATWSSLEVDHDPRYTLATWDRAAHAVGTVLNAYLPETTAAGTPRDAAHLPNQELVLRTARPGGWVGVPEQALDRELTRSRLADVVLERNRRRDLMDEWCLVEVTDWTADVGESVREFDRRLAGLDRHAVSRMRGDGPAPIVSGIWLLRATLRNRRLISEHRLFFRSRFPGSGRAWLGALIDARSDMPREPALLWVDVRGTRIFAARLGE